MLALCPNPRENPSLSACSCARTMSTPPVDRSEYNLESASSPGSARRRPVALLACTHCRYKHLKCDAKLPTCSRCRLDKRDCQYLQSKRGHKRPKTSLDTTRLPSQSGRNERLPLVVVDTREDSNNIHNLAVDQALSDRKYQLPSWMHNLPRLWSFPHDNDQAQSCNNVLCPVRSHLHHLAW